MRGPFAAIPGGRRGAVSRLAVRRTRVASRSVEGAPIATAAAGCSDGRPKTKTKTMTARIAPAMAGSATEFLPRSSSSHRRRRRLGLCRLGGGDCVRGIPRARERGGASSCWRRLRSGTPRRASRAPAETLWRRGGSDAKGPTERAPATATEDDPPTMTEKTKMKKGATLACCSCRLLLFLLVGD